MFHLLICLRAMHRACSLSLLHNTTPHNTTQHNTLSVAYRGSNNSRCVQSETGVVRAAGSCVGQARVQWAPNSLRPVTDGGASRKETRCFRVPVIFCSVIVCRLAGWLNRLFADFTFLPALFALSLSACLFYPPPHPHPTPTPPPPHPPPN